MASINTITAYDEFWDYLAPYAEPQAILAFHASADAQARANEFTIKRKSDTLTPSETEEA